MSFPHPGAEYNISATSVLSPVCMINAYLSHIYSNEQDGWTSFCFIARFLPPATLSGGSFVALLADRPVDVADVVVYIEYISASMGNASHAAVMLKNRSYLTKVMQAAAMAPMYGPARPSQGAVARRMRTKAGY